MIICARDLVVRAADFEQRAAELSLELRPWQWEFLYALDGRALLGDLARRLGLEMQVVTEIVTAFNEQNLVTIRTVPLEEYRQKMNMNEKLGADPQSPNGVVRGVKPEPAAPAAPAGPATGSIGFKIK